MVFYPACRAVALLTGLLAATTSASADCGWVVWQEQTGMSTEKGAPTRNYREWEIAQATSSEAECRVAMAQAVQARADQLKRPGDANAPTLTIEQQTLWMQFPGSIFAYRFLCLPATVDPRGPAGR